MFKLKFKSVLIAKLLLTMSVASLGAGCVPGAGPKQTGGTLVGAVAGGLLGSQIGGGHGRLLMVGLGTAAGALFGSYIGNQLDNRDRQMADINAQRALDQGSMRETYSWHNPDTGHNGDFRVTSYDSTRGSNWVCKNFVSSVYIDNRREEAQGRACKDRRDPQAVWQIQT